MITYYKPRISVVKDRGKYADSTILVLDVPFESKKDASRYVERNRESILDSSSYEQILRVSYKEYVIYESLNEVTEDDFRLVSPAATKEKRP